MIKSRNKPTVAGLGEILWDILPEREKLGGAPANFAYHACSLGAEAAVISSVGRDERGTLALEILAEKGLRTDCITLAAYPTGYVRAEFDERGVATYTFPDDVAWDHLEIGAPARALAARLDAVCFGTLAQRSSTSRRAIRDYLGSLPPAARRVYDVNLRQHFYTRTIIDASLTMSTIVKLNDDELDLLTPMLSLTGSTADRLEQLVSSYGLELIILTRGDGGSILLNGRQRSIHPGIQTEVTDTIGAGDAFTAAAVLGLLDGADLDTINDSANRLAAYVCTQPGAMVPAPPGFTRG